MRHDARFVTERAGIAARARGAAYPLLAWIAGTIFVAREALRVHTLQPDELLAVYGGRYIRDHFPRGVLSAHVSGRGFERLTAVLFGLVDALASSTAQAFRIQHVLMAALLTAVVFPAYGWARQLGNPRWLALLAGVAAMVTPWAVWGTSLLDIAPAYTFTTLALWAIAYALVARTPAADLMALAAIVLVAVTRVGNSVIVVSLPIGVLAMSYVRERRMGAAIRSALREHRLVWSGVAVAILLIAVRGTHSLVGGYSTRLPAPDGRFATELRIGVNQLSSGTALLAVMIGGAWMLWSLFQTRRDDARALSWVVVVSFLALAFAAITQAPEERYVAALAPAAIVAFVTALHRRDVPWWLVAIVGVVVARLAALGVPVPGGAYGYSSAPAATWFHQVVLGRASLHLPGGGSHALTIVVVAAAVMAAVVIATRFRRLGYAAVALVTLNGLFGAQWSMRKFVDAAGRPELSFERLAWVDGAAGSADAAILDFDQVGNVPYGPTYAEVASFNAHVRGVLTFDGHSGVLCCGSEARRGDIAVNTTTGTVTSKLPPLLLTIQGFRPVGLDLVPVAQSDYLPQTVMLERVLSRRVRFAIVRGSAVGAATPGQPLTVRFFDPGADDCAVFAFAQTMASLRSGGRRLAATYRDGLLKGSLARYAGRASVDVTLVLHPGGLISGIDLLPCR
jgi:hypothetical protein